MPKTFKYYLYDAIINIFAQIFVLFAGYISLIISDYAIIGWILLVIGYSIILAKMEQSCEKKCAVFKHYVIWVMLPPNIIALVVSSCLLAVGTSSLTLKNTAVGGVLVLIGSITITLLSVFFIRACRTAK